MWLTENRSPQSQMQMTLIRHLDSFPSLKKELVGVAQPSPHWNWGVRLRLEILADTNPGSASFSTRNAMPCFLDP